MDERSPASREVAWYMALGQLGLEMAAPIVLGLWLDSHFQTQPWLTVAGAVVGFVGGMTHLLIVVNQPPGPDGAGDKRVPP